MRSLLPIAAIVVSAAALASGTAGAQAVPHGNPAAGLETALHRCESCHIVATNQDIKPLVQNYAPSFFEIANRADTDARRLTAYLSAYHPKGNMPYPELSIGQVSDLTSYILSLRGGR